MCIPGFEVNLNTYSVSEFNLTVCVCSNLWPSGLKCTGCPVSCVQMWTVNLKYCAIPFMDPTFHFSEWSRKVSENADDVIYQIPLYLKITWITHHPRVSRHFHNKKRQHGLAFISLNNLYNTHEHGNCFYCFYKIYSVWKP